MGSDWLCNAGSMMPATVTWSALVASVTFAEHVLKSQSSGQAMNGPFIAVLQSCQHS